MDRRLGLGACFLVAAALAACNTGGGNVTAGNPLNPTPAPSAAVTPTPTAGPPTPTPSPTPVGPTPTPTPTAAACGAPPPDPNTATITITGAKQTVTVPCFGDFTSTALVPPSSGAGDTVSLAASTDKNLGGVPDGTYGKPISYTSLQPLTSIAFTGTAPQIITSVTSPSKISAPHTYAIQVYVPNFGGPIQTVTGLKPVGHTVTFPIVPPGGSFPAIEAVVILYQSS